VAPRPLHCDKEQEQGALVGMRHVRFTAIKNKSKGRLLGCATSASLRSRVRARGACVGHIRSGAASLRKSKGGLLGCATSASLRKSGKRRSCGSHQQWSCIIKKGQGALVRVRHVRCTISPGGSGGGAVLWTMAKAWREKGWRAALRAWGGAQEELGNSRTSGGGRAGAWMESQGEGLHMHPTGSTPPCPLAPCRPC